MKRSNSLNIFSVFFIGALLFTCCKKQSTAPRSSPPTTQSFADTSKSGTYKMIACDKAGEIDTTLAITLWYWSADTSGSTVFTTYHVKDNKSPQYYCYVSKTVQWHDPTNLCALKCYGTHVTHSFGGSVSNVNGTFSGDTLTLPLSVTPVSGAPYTMICKYKR